MSPASLLADAPSSSPDLVSAKRQHSVEVIVNRHAKTDKIALRELRSIYAMKSRRWADGSEITVFVLNSESPVHREFSKKRLNVFPNQLESIWYRHVYTATGQAPIRLKSIDEMIQKVAETPGSIGYLDNNNIEKITKYEDVKILSID